MPNSHPLTEEKQKEDCGCVNYAGNGLLAKYCAEHLKDHISKPVKKTIEEDIFEKFEEIYEPTYLEAEAGFVERLHTELREHISSSLTRVREDERKRINGDIKALEEAIEDLKQLLQERGELSYGVDTKGSRDNKSQRNPLGTSLGEHHPKGETNA